jgi:hypothetical protein
VINYSIDVQNGVAYLIGRVKDKAELDRALNIARTTKGIKRVVSHLQINADVERPTQSDASSQTESASPDYGQPSSPAVGSSSTPVSSGGGSDIYTGPVYGSGSISSSPN